jgi:hypothetical protein
MDLIYCADPAIQTGIAHKPHRNQYGARKKPSGRLGSDRLGDSLCWPSSTGALFRWLGHRNQRCV